MIRVVAAWMVFLAALTPRSAAGQEAKAQEGVSVSFPGKSWTVKIDSPGFAVETNERKPDGRQYLLANNSTTGVVLSVTLEQSKGGADSGTCPDYLQKRVASMSNLGVKDVKTSQIDSMAIIEYMVPTAQGIPVEQKSVVACAAKEDVYIDIHLSKVKFQPPDESLFTTVLNQVHIVDQTGGPAAPSASGTTSLDYFREGSRYYIANDYKNAISTYQKALDLEKQQPELSKNYWRVLVDNLGMAYGITNNLDQAEATFNYGVSKDPSYPMFYYNLGCVYAERNDMGKTMSYLSKAFSLKANSIPGEGMPDPRQDDSFQRFMSNEQFRKFVNTLVAGH